MRGPIGLVHRSLYEVIWVLALLTGVFLLCLWARHFTLDLPLSTKYHRSVIEIAKKCIMRTSDGLAFHETGIGPLLWPI